MAFEQVFKNIDNALRTDEGCSSELDYVEQSSWILFLKYLDVLEYIAYQKKPVNRAARVQNAQLYTGQQTPEQVAFIQYLVSVYVKAGIDELEADRLPKLMANKYGTIVEGTTALGGIEQARGTFYNFQRNLYQQAI